MEGITIAIRNTYRATGSIKATAKELEISEQTIRRVLLQCGDYTNDTAQRIHRLSEAGKTVDEIAADLRMTRNTVLAYLPYSRTPYISPEKTKNARRISAWRARKKMSPEGGDAAC